MITDGQGLNITLVGYLGQLHFGLVSCRELVPDLETLASYLTEELEILAKAASERSAGQPAEAKRARQEWPCSGTTSANGTRRWSLAAPGRRAGYRPASSSRPPMPTRPDNDWT